jgi:hypothetical protein
VSIFTPKRFFNAERHLAGKISFAIQQAGQGGPGNFKSRRGRGHRHAGGLNNPRPNAIAGMGRVLHGHGVLFLLSCVTQIDVDTPAGIGQSIDVNAIAVFPVVIALARIPSFQS